jgi:aspartate/methionine/tyrosine aminotransferase
LFFFSILELIHHVIHYSRIHLYIFIGSNTVCKYFIILLLNDCDKKDNSVISLKQFRQDLQLVYNMMNEFENEKKNK